MNKLAIITGFLGGVKNRYITYQEDRTLEEKFDIASQINGLDGLELCYPQDFENFELLKELINRYGFEIPCINFRSRRTGKWLRGSFSSQIASERREVVQDFKMAIDYAQILGCNRVTTCPLNDGHDYIFEMDYTKAFDFFEYTIGEVASYNKKIRICIEYKLNDPRTRCLLGNAGETLAFCQILGMDNVGVTLDFGHSIQAGERPAQTAVMLARANRLFYVHLNDNDKLWDWDMVPGAYNFWDLVEFFYYLKKIGYNDWFGYDVSPKEINTIKTFNTVIELTQKIFDISSRLELDIIERILEKRDPVDNIKYLYSII
ncbi:xylose isomerase [Caldicoprobacter guelmensis]|uniref:sugar phosphate isomerase/epimerase family protein n=1 Tax=Caldicoprobacter guelmensis TaxID=1170224 RepID=UPI001956828B|nr:sugar phosphate isomerase/epimerase family protein [Caldicoprobacter guelmensis]MBM7583415.1 xylose isomerase [Caldicoprobacter guelmensis]